MNKKNDVIKAIISLTLLAVIITIIMVVTFLILTGLDEIGIFSRLYSGYIWYGIAGVLAGIGAGFGFVIAKRLFDFTFDK